MIVITIVLTIIIDNLHFYGYSHYYHSRDYVYHGS